jgi:CheY-like chemotaxis protein/REP element-mobilizing transposase RayT
MMMRLLLADPDIPFAAGLKQALEGTGEFQVSLAANGAAAEEVGGQAEYDVVVVGFDPPDMDVMELLRRMRLLQPDAAIILCPETTVQHERARFLVVDGSMGKPFTAREFIPYLRKVLQRSKGPEITPPTPGVQDEFVPPQMPSVIRGLTQRPPPRPTRSPTDLLDWMERKKFQDEASPLDHLSSKPPAQSRAADILEEFEALEHARSGEVSPSKEPQEPDAASGRQAAPEPEDRSPHITWPKADQTPDTPPGQPSGEKEPPQTRRLGQTDEPVDTQRLRDTEELPPRARPTETVRLDWEDPNVTRRLPDDTFDSMVEARSRSAREEPAALPTDEPPPRQDDTPTVPPHDLEGVRQFLATDRGTHDPYDFGEVLDAIAQSSPSDYDRLAHDPEFHDLVDSMSMPEGARPRRTRLDDLLASIAADLPEEAPPSDSDSALDYVLEAIRRGAVPVPPGEEETADSDLGDATIGDVIEGLFDPSFEGVLAALAGKEIEEESIDEPTYGRAAEAAESLEPQAEDQFRPEEMSADEDQPAWLLAYEVEEIVPPQPLPAPLQIEEPPITEEDSSHYPATTALTAVTGAQETDDFSLDRLLEQIEKQLPPPRSQQPHLKPLPSWQKPGQIESAHDVAALFDRMEGKEIEQVTPDDIVETPDDSVPAAFAEADDEPSAPPLIVEPPLAAQDTRPSLSIREALTQAPIQDTDTTPFAPVLPEEPAATDTGQGEQDHSEAVAALEGLFAGEEQHFPAAPGQAEAGEIISDEELFALAERFARNAAEAWEAELSPDILEEASTGEPISAQDLFTLDGQFAGTPAEEWEAGQPSEVAQEIAEESDYAEEAGPVSVQALFAFDVQPAEPSVEEWDAGPSEAAEESDYAEYAEPASAQGLFTLDEQPAEPSVEEWDAEPSVEEWDAGPSEAAEESDYAEEAESASAQGLFTLDEQPAEPAAEEWEAGEAEVTGAVETAEIIAEQSLFALDERPAEPPPEEWEAGEAEPLLDEDVIAQAFFEGVRSTAEHDALDLFREEPAVSELEETVLTEEVAEEGDRRAAVPSDQEAVEGIFGPDVEHLVPVPVEEAFLMLEGEPYSAEAARADEEEKRLAQAAVLLTQYSLESSAQATMLSRPGKLLAQAGDLPSVAMQRLFQLVDNAWLTSTAPPDALIRFITLPDAGEFLLYSTHVEYDLVLSMVFNANTSVRTIRRQARRLSESLDLVPEELPEEPPAAKTLPSRPTDLRPPAGLREAVAAHPSAAVEESLPVPPVEDAGPYTGYTCLWLPRDPGQELLGDFADALYQWIMDIADDSAWELHHLDIRPDYLVLSLSVPQKTLPDAAVTLLMDETARRSAKYFPDVVPGVALWADGYYVVAPPRELSEREIARFITYQRQAQLG